MTEPETRADAIEAALTTLAGTERLLVALDFDGTLAPLVDRPEDARALPEGRAAMLALVRAPDTTVALISGRAMQSLMHVADPPDSVWLSGSHGVEVRLDAAPAVSLTEEESHAVSRLRTILEDVAAPFEGIWVEVKPAGFALHSRASSDQDAASAQQQAHERVHAELPQITERRGNNVLEFSVRSTTKGDAVRMLREASGATAVLFAGDDVTDEDGFAVLGDGDVGIKCGPGETVAQYRVSDPAAVAGVLARLAELRSH